MSLRQPLLALAIAAICFPLVAPAATEIRLVSDDGEEVGKGETYTLNESNGSLTISQGDSQSILIKWDNMVDEAFELRFESASGQLLSVGEYADALGYSGPNQGRPGLVISSSGVSCDGITGYFVIHEVEYDQSGVATKLALDAVQHCFGAINKLVATVRINSEVPFEVGPRIALEEDFIVQPGEPVSASVASMQTTNGIIESIQWRQLSGPDVVANGLNTSTISFIAEASDAETESYVFEAIAADTAGETASDTITVISSARTVPISRMRIIDHRPGADNAPYEVDIDPRFFHSSNFDGAQTITYDTGDGLWWSLNVSAPQNGLLSNGQYHNAFAYSGPDTHPQLVIGGRRFQYCGEESLAFFNILDVAYTDTLYQTRLAIDAAVDCPDGLDELIEIRLRFNSVVPMDSLAPISNPGPDQIVIHGQSVVLDAGSSQNDAGSLQSFLWTQVSGPPVALVDADKSTASFIAPDVPAGLGKSEFELTVINDSGRTDTEAVIVDIRGSADPVSFVDLLVLPDTGGDWVTASDDADFRLDENLASFESGKNGISTSLKVRQFGDWIFRFGSDGTPYNNDPNISVGLYENAQQRGDNAPYIAVSAPGRGCNYTLGEFVVHEIEEDSDGIPTSMAVDFQQICDGGAILYGKVRFNSTVPADAPSLFASAGPNLDAVPEQVVVLDAAASYIGPTGGVDYLWEQVSGPAVSIDNANLQQASFVAPDLSGTAVFRVTITNSEGLISTALATVALAGPGGTLSAMFISSEDGDPVGLGSDYYFDANQFRIRNYEPNRITMGNIDAGAVWYWLSLEAPDGLSLLPGDYVNSTEIFNSIGTPAITGFPGMGFTLPYRSCQSSLGWYRIYEIEAAADGQNLEKFAADFYQTCELGDPGLIGSIRLNSSVPARPGNPVATAGQNLVARAGENITLSAEQSFSWHSTITGYQWQQISGPTAVMAGAATATPTVTLPALASGTAELAFQVTVSDAAGRQEVATTIATVVAPDSKLTDVSISFFDRQTGLENESYDYDVNNSYAHLEQTALPGLDAFIEGRQKDLVATFELDYESAALQKGVYYLPRYEGTRPLVRSGTNDYACGSYDPGLVHVTDFAIDAGEITSIAFESEHYCSDTLGIRTSARLNSTSVINRGEVVLIQTPDRDITEGETVRLDDVAAYIQGEHALSVDWEQQSGPGIIFSRSSGNARSSFVAPATNGDSEVVLTLSVTSQSNQVFTEDVRFGLIDNGIMGFPAASITVNSVPGTYNATGDPVGFESEHIVALVPQSPDVSNSSPLLDRVPYGVFEMEFDTDPGETISFTIRFPSPVAANAEWMNKVDPRPWEQHQESWVLAADRLSMIVNITDGGQNDRDFRTNGIVQLRGGIAERAVVTPSPIIPTTPEKSGGGALDFGSTAALLFFACLAFRYRVRCDITGKSPETLLAQQLATNSTSTSIFRVSWWRRRQSHCLVDQ